ncbi:hypothetical protein AGMMS49982_00980 [Bacteroidia bacterium]|nr:hypothetical protein AGMMS49982_00980 [Bacteroidia bacterium]
MKKVVLFAALVAVVSLSSCGGKNTAKESSCTTEEVIVEEMVEDESADAEADVEAPAQ